MDIPASFKANTEILMQNREEICPLIVGRIRERSAISLLMSAAIGSALSNFSCNGKVPIAVMCDAFGKAFLLRFRLGSFGHACGEIAVQNAFRRHSSGCRTYSFQEKRITGFSGH